MREAFGLSRPGLVGTPAESLGPSSFLPRTSMAFRSSTEVQAQAVLRRREGTRRKTEEGQEDTMSEKRWTDTPGMYLRTPTRGKFGGQKVYCGRVWVKSLGKFKHFILGTAEKESKRRLG